MNPGKKKMITMVALFIVMTTIFAVQNQNATSPATTLQLHCSTELADLANVLTEQYQEENAHVKISVATIPENGIDEMLGAGEIALVNKNCLPAIAGEHGLRLVVGRNVIVPVMNANHPQKEIITQKGITPKQFATIYKSSHQISWGQLLHTENRSQIVAYMPGKRCAKRYLTDFLNTSSEEINAKEVDTPEEMIRKVAADPNAIGFCNLACLSNMKQNGTYADINLIPVDVDGDGEVEWFENIYSSYETLSHGIFVGKYPRELYSRIYAVTGLQPLTDAETAFLEWIITDGQESVAMADILNLDYGEKASGMRNLYPPSPAIVDLPAKSSTARIPLIILGGFMILGILVWVFSSWIGKRQGTFTVSRLSQPDMFEADAATFPAGLFFDRSHTWAFMEKTGNVRIGIDDFIQHVTGSVTRVLMKSPGEKITKGETLLTIVQQGKQLEIKSPVSGVVIAQNDALLKDSSILNREPFSAGWVYMVEPVNWMAEIKSFFMGEPYGVWLKAEFSRLKDFFATGLKLKGNSEPLLVLQDGGEIKDGVLENFSPQVWEEFQTIFINRKN